jgi:hypothetical protein
MRFIEWGAAKPLKSTDGVSFIARPAKDVVG